MFDPSHSIQGDERDSLLPYNDGLLPEDSIFSNKFESESVSVIAPALLRAGESFISDAKFVSGRDIESRVDFYGMVLSRRFISIFCVVMVIIGGIGQGAGLPLFVAPLNPYFVLLFASLIFAIVFFVVCIPLYINGTIGKLERNYPHKYLFLIGFFDAMNGILVVFASPPTRTPPFLQAILGNIAIPITFVLSLLVLGRKSTMLHIIAAGIVVLGLVVSLLPSIMSWNAQLHHVPVSVASYVNYIVWPLIFAFGFLPGALMNVLSEKVFKVAAAGTKARLNVFFLLAWTSLYQFLSLLCMFWVNVLPWFGEEKSVAVTFEKVWSALRCVGDHGDGCGYSGLWATVFIGSYILSYIFGGLLMRYASANYSVVASALVTPLTAFFWTFFEPNKVTGGLQYHTTLLHDKRNIFLLGSVPIVVAGIVMYELVDIARLKRLKQQEEIRHNLFTPSMEAK